MLNREVPPPSWVRRLNELTTLHDGWLVSLDVRTAGLGSHAEIVNLPLLGISADRINDDRTVAISVSGSAREHFTHFIPDVTRLFVEHADDGGEAAMVIESADRTVTTISLRAPALPGCVSVSAGR